MRHKNLDLSTELIRSIGHRKEIQKPYPRANAQNAHTSMPCATAFIIWKLLGNHKVE